MGLIVSLGKRDKAIMGEQSEFGDPVGHIAEMVTDPTKLDHFSPGWGAKGAALALAAEDDKPEFAVIRVEEGWSGSRRLWDGVQLESIAEQTNRLEPVGHLGHIEDAKAGTAFPDPQSTWFGAVTKMEPSQQKDRLGEMVKTIYLAAYTLPPSVANIRTLIKSRAVRGISWWGEGDVVPVPGKGVAVKSFTLKAIDWARKLSEGMPTSRIVAIAREMEDKSMDKELSQVTPEEFKKENPNGYQLLVTQATAEQAVTIGEMQEKVDEGEKAKSLLTRACELLGIEKPEEIEAKLTALKTKIGEKAKLTLDNGLDALLLQKLPGDENKDRRALVKRLLPIGEMEARLTDGDEADADKIIGEMVDEAFDTDETIKVQIGEMQPPVIRRREDFRSGNDTDKAIEAAGMTRGRVSVGG